MDPSLWSLWAWSLYLSCCYSLEVVLKTRWFYYRWVLQPNVYCLASAWHSWSADIFLTLLHDEFEPLRTQILARHTCVSLMDALMMFTMRRLIFVQLVCCLLWFQFWLFGFCFRLHSLLLPRRRCRHRHLLLIQEGAVVFIMIIVDMMDMWSISVKEESASCSSFFTDY